MAGVRRDANAVYWPCKVCNAEHTISSIRFTAYNNQLSIEVPKYVDPGVNSDCSVPHVSSMVYKFVFHFHFSVFQPQCLVAIVDI
jgi:hypothetical protein